MSARQTTILTVDDEPETCEMIDRALVEAGFRALSVTSADGLHGLLPEADILLLDVNLPDANGIELARELRARYSKLGIIIVTAQTEEIDRIIGLEVGADDYVCKPFNIRELVARIRSVLRRVREAQQTAPRRFRFLDYQVDLDTGTVTRDGNLINLTGHEFKLLSVLAQQPEKVFGRDELSRRVSEKAWDPSNRSIDVLVSKLRKKLNAGEETIIRSLRGVGYQFACRLETDDGSGR